MYNLIFYFNFILILQMTFLKEIQLNGGSKFNKFSVTIGKEMYHIYDSSLLYKKGNEIMVPNLSQQLEQQQQQGTTKEVQVKEKQDA